jgi:hypothetical protein
MTAAATIVAGAKFGHLDVIGVDAGGRRVACRCVCTKVLTLSADALRGGRTSCGCKPLSREQSDALRRETTAQICRDLFWGNER